MTCPPNSVPTYALISHSHSCSLHLSLEAPSVSHGDPCQNWEPGPSVLPVLDDDNNNAPNGAQPEGGDEQGGQTSEGTVVSDDQVAELVHPGDDGGMTDTMLGSCGKRWDRSILVTTQALHVQGLHNAATIGAPDLVDNFYLNDVYAAECFAPY